MSKTNKQKQNRPKAGHSFPGCREPFLNPGPRSGASAQVYNLTTDSGGSVVFQQVLAPIGLTSTVLSSGNYTAGTYGNVTGPPLRGLYNKASDFQWYRISRARLIFVSNMGSTATGQITLSGYTDPADTLAVTTQAYVSGANTKTFDISAGAGKELSVPVPVDSTWKKVSSVMSYPGNAFPFTGAAATSFVAVATVSDLACGAVGAYITGFSMGTLVGGAFVGTLHLEYDIEFKGVIDSAVNV